MLRKKKNQNISQAQLHGHVRVFTDLETTCRKWSTRKKAYRFVFAIVVLLFFLIWNGSFIKDSNERNDIQVFQLQSGKDFPSHLDLINPQTDLKSMGFRGLDSAHRGGMIHKGAWIHLVDSSLSDDMARILTLKRGKDLVTCPNTWGLIGEHTYRDEPSIKTVRRAILEELGSTFLDHMDANGSILNLTEYPVYYERDYGASNGDRIDRQVTWLWLVEMNFDMKERGRQEADNLLQLDDEVADHSWVPLDDFERWVKSDALLKDFCHDTITSLLRLGIERMKILAKNKLDAEKR